MSKTLTQRQRDENDELRRENEELREAVARLLTDTTHAGLLSQLTAATQRLEQTIRQDTLDAIAPVTAASQRWTAVAESILACAGCDDGPRTREMVGKLLEEFGASVVSLDTAVARIKEQGLIELTNFPYRDLQWFAAALYVRAKNYAAAGHGDTQALQWELREFVGQYLPDVKCNLYNAIDDSKHRGRPKTVRPETRAAIDALDNARRSLNIPDDYEKLERGQIDAIRRQAINILDNVRKPTRFEKQASTIIGAATKQQLSQWINLGRSSTKNIIVDDLDGSVV